MSEKIFNTRILLKYDTYEEWSTNNPLLKKGEVAITTVSIKQEGTVNSVPSVLLKVGNGINTYNDLDFVYAKAADVIEAAKSESTLTTFVNNVIANAGIASDEAMTALSGRVTTLEDLVGETAVGTQISNAIAALKLGETYESKGSAAQALVDAKSYTDTEVAKKVGSVGATDSSIEISGSATAPTVGVKLSEETGNNLSIKTDGLYVQVPEGAEYSIVKDDTSSEYAAVYHLTKNGTNTGASINIPKDMVVQSGTVEVNPEGQTAGTYLVLTLANSTNDKIYINVGDLIEYVTSGSVEGDSVVIAVSDDHKVTATITDGSITKAKLEASVQTSLNKADSALQKSNITSGTTNGTISVGGTDVSVAGLGSAAFAGTGDFDAVGAADTVKTDLTELINKKANSADLAAIATSGNVNDLIQSDGDIIVFNCGSSTEVI